MAIYPRSRVSPGESQTNTTMFQIMSCDRGQGTAAPRASHARDLSCGIAVTPNHQWNYYCIHWQAKGNDDEFKNSEDDPHLVGTSL